MVRIIIFLLLIGAAGLAREYLRTAAADDSARFRARCAERGLTLPGAAADARGRGRE